MISRRTFVQLSSVATAATLTRHGWGADPLQDLPLDNPQAQALKYTENAAGTAPEGQTCANCMHFKSLDDTSGSCALFPTFKVKSAGWCAGWVKQQ